MRLQLLCCAITSALDRVIRDGILTIDNAWKLFAEDAEDNFYALTHLLNYMPPGERTRPSAPAAPIQRMADSRIRSAPHPPSPPERGWNRRCSCLPLSRV